MNARLAGSLAVATLALSGCGPDLEPQVRALGPKVAELTEERAANATFLQGAETLETLQNKPGTTTFAWGPDDLERAADDVLPLRLDAGSFHKQLEGIIVVERLSGLRFTTGNRIDGIATLRGEGIRYTGSVPSMFKAQVAQFIAGVEAGVNVSLRMRVVLAAPKLEVHVTALDATMAKNGGNESMLLDEMNKRALRSPFLFDLSADPRLKPVAALVTAKHLALLYTGSANTAPAPRPAPTTPPPAVTPAPARTPPASPPPAPTGGPTRPRRPGS